MDDKKLKDQLNFFDYIYPSISRQLDELKKSCHCNEIRIIELHHERKSQGLLINQYKKKIQRIEQMLIEHGLIDLLRNK